MPFAFLRALLLAALVLTPGEPVERELAGGGAQDFHIEAQGQPLLITVEQDGVDVALALQEPAGKPLGIMNTAIERSGTETWLIPAEAEGTYRLEVRSAMPGTPKGRFRVRVEELPAAPAERIEAERLSTEAGLLFAKEDGEARRQALALYKEALARWQALGRKADEARALFRLAILHQNLGEWQPMLDRLQEALPLFATVGDRAQEADVLTYIGVAFVELGRYREVIASNERSLEIRRARNDRWGEAVTSLNLCLVRLYLSEWREAIGCYEELLPLLEEVGENDAEALNGLGGAYSALGEPRKAREHYTRSLEKRRALKDWTNEARVLNNLAVLAADQDELGDALVYYGQALEAFRKLGDRDWEARTLSNLGNVYLALGDPQRALGYFQEALPIRQEVGNRRGEVVTLGLLGLARERLGEVREALKLYEQALRIAKEIENPTGEATSLNLLAQGHLTAGDLARALELFKQAAALQRRLENRGGLAFALQRTGEVEARLGQREKALDTFREALDLHRLLGDPAGQAETLSSLAAAERALGRLEDALSHAGEAIGLIESVRASVADPSLRASFLASRRLAFDLALALRMDLESRQPGKGHAEAALALSERARARSLLDLLHEAGTEIRQGIPQELRDRESSLAYQLGRKARELRAPQSEEKGAQLRRELAGLLAEADRLQDEIRRSNSRYTVLNQPPLDAAGIRGLLDPETVLLEYTLGEEKSFLWVVTSERVESFELAGRAEIEAAARRIYEDVSKLEKMDAEAHRELSRLLFGKAANRLHCRRLVIVADGALQYVPFAILPDPEDPSIPLVAGHEIVSLPSASVLDVQRRVLAGRPAAAKAVAILADPVFKASDSRLLKPGAPRSLPPDAAGERLQRLPATGREAKAIAKLLAPGQVFLALGAKASRATALSGDLAGHRAVHFATHGLISAETPLLSSLALSMFDEKGQPQEGSLGLSDVYKLKLDADLVVLSGCETALGREIRGEGLMGLTQGFFYAGAERVMASLWRVEDRATAELMSRFYQAMFKDGLPPAAALRSAQLAIRSDPRWQDPFYWAPFVLQGDWR
jgi:CHAT domain-containing protein/tetratricopeptide (TPR) repeat protein